MKKACFLFLFVFLISCSSTVPLPGNLTHPSTKSDFKLTIEFLPTPLKEKKNYPVVICHGLMANRNYFKINGDTSLVKSLLNSGFDVYLVELRGRESAGGVNLFWGNSYLSYGFDEYVEEDVPTLIESVLKLSNAPKIHWVGHSMGGMVMYARLGIKKDERIASLTTIGSPLYFPFPSKTLRSWNTFSILLNLTPLIPTRPFAKSYGTISFPYLPKGYLRDMILYEENATPELREALYRNSVENVANKEAKQFSNALEGSGFQSRNGVLYTQNLKNIETPLLAIAGRRDHLGSPGDVRMIFDSVSSKEKRYYIVEKSGGAKEEYGHTDLVMGTYASLDVFPVVLEWLKQEDKK